LYSCERWFLKGLLIMFNTCSCDVMPPGILMRSLFAFLISPLASWVRCPLKASKPSIPRLLRRKPCFVVPDNSDSVHHEAIAYPNFFLAASCFGIIFLHEMTYGSCLCSSVRILSILVIIVFSLSKPLIKTVTTLFPSIGMSDGMSKYTGVRFEFLIWPSIYMCYFLNFITCFWTLTVFSAHSPGSLCVSVVCCCKVSLAYLIIQMSHPVLAVNLTGVCIWRDSSQCVDAYPAFGNLHYAFRAHTQECTVLTHGNVLS